MLGVLHASLSYLMYLLLLPVMQLHCSICKYASCCLQFALLKSGIIKGTFVQETCSILIIVPCVTPLLLHMSLLPYWWWYFTFWQQYVGNAFYVP